MIENFKDLFNYELVFSSKRKRTCSIKIIDKIAIISLPMKFSKVKLIELLEEKKYWILTHINKDKKIRKLIENGKILFLGNEIEVKVKESLLLKKYNYEFIDNKLIINTPKNPSDKNIEKSIIDWYKQKFQKIIQERTKQLAGENNFKYKDIKLGSQKTVWGTCDANNNLCFNYKAIIFKPEVIDYLIIHELSHTIHKNHSKKFWSLVEKILPNYKKLRSEMKIGIW